MVSLKVWNCEVYLTLNQTIVLYYTNHDILWFSICNAFTTIPRFLSIYHSYVCVIVLPRVFYTQISCILFNHTLFNPNSPFCIVLYPCLHSRLTITSVRIWSIPTINAPTLNQKNLLINQWECVSGLAWYFDICAVYCQCGVNCTVSWQHQCLANLNCNNRKIIIWCMR